MGPQGQIRLEETAGGGAKGSYQSWERLQVAEPQAEGESETIPWPCSPYSPPSSEEIFIESRLVYIRLLPHQ